MSIRHHSIRKYKRFTQHNSSGFTMIELLVVMSISIVLVGLVMGPVVQTFQMTRRAQAMIDAQDSARQASEQISRELGEALYVYDNAVTTVTLFNDRSTNLAPYGSGGKCEGPIQLPVRLPIDDPTDNVKGFTLPYAKIDFVLPKMTMHCNNPGHGDSPRDYPRNELAFPPCPVCDSPDVVSRPKLPMEQDVTVVRYFLGLKYNGPDDDSDPTDPKYAGWKSPYGKNVTVEEGNQVVLYRAEFSPYDNTLFPPDMPVGERLSDPIFFYRTANNSSGEPCYKAWARKARVVGMGNYEDLLEVTYDKNTGFVATVEPTVTFRSTAIDNDTFSGAYSSDKTFEYPTAVPTVFRSTYGYWVPGYNVSVYRDDFTVAYYTGVDSSSRDLWVWKTSYDDSSGWSSPVKHFNIDEYLRTGDFVSSGNSEDIEMAFYIDHAVVDNNNNVISPSVDGANRGEVNFGLTPPNLRNGDNLNTAWINDEFRSTPGSDRGAARRYAVLSTFDSGSSNYLKNARIVPGSEVVRGPNMTPGLGYGNPIRYERVPLALGDPGLNQYKIDYDSGIIYFSSVYNQNLPEGYGDINVRYKIQFNKKDDVVRGDYSTKSLISIHIGMRMFDPDSGKPHAVDLNQSVKVRNAVR